MVKVGWLQGELITRHDKCSIEVQFFPKFPQQPALSFSLDSPGCGQALRLLTYNAGLLQRNDLIERKSL